VPLSVEEIAGRRATPPLVRAGPQRARKSLYDQQSWCSEVICAGKNPCHGIL